MNTLLQFSVKPSTIPAQTAWYLADLAESIGRQELYTHQNPEKLRQLREFAIIESAISSNRIEGVNVDASRVATLMFGSPQFQDRNEEEVRGYRDALNLVHERGRELPISEESKRNHHHTWFRIPDQLAFEVSEVMHEETGPFGAKGIG